MKGKKRLIDLTSINKDFTHLSQFVKYPYDYLEKFTKEIDKNKHKMTVENIKHIIHLLEVDIFCLRMGLENKIHPITGYLINTNIRIKKVNNLIERDKMWIRDLVFAMEQDVYDV